jgi:hypothetical protein
MGKKSLIREHRRGAMHYESAWRYAALSRRQRACRQGPSAVTIDDDQDQL